MISETNYSSSLTYKAISVGPQIWRRTHRHN